MVHGREQGEQVDEFGVSGYVYRNRFIIYDRRTTSLWYTLDDEGWTAVSGPRKGEVIPLISELSVITLGEWRKEHPNTVVLLGDKRALEKPVEREQKD